MLDLSEVFVQYHMNNATTTPGGEKALHY